MLVEVVRGNNSLIIDVPDDVSEVLPFTSELIRWKEEVYFSTPYTAKLDVLKAYTQVMPGKVYYWPPEKAFCIFYGFSEPYSEVYLLGDYIGPLASVRKVGVGNVHVVNHTISDELRGIADTLSKLGYAVATPLDGGSRVVATSKYVDGIRIAFTIINESFGVYVESDSLYLHTNSYNDIKITYKLKSRLKSLASNVRVDLNEDNYVCLTAITRDISNLSSVVRELENAYQYVFRELTTS